MDVAKYFEAGGTVIKNPNYTKSKKNLQPKYITVSDLNSDAVSSSNNDVSAAYEVAQTNVGVIGDTKDYEKYIKHGIHPNSTTNLDEELADAQSNWTKAGNMLFQAVVSEFGLGTINAAVSMIDSAFSIPLQKLGIVNNDYTNPIIDTLNDTQEYLNEDFAPIYVKPGVDIQNGGFGNAGWWFKNSPTVVSSLTMLYPAKGVLALGKFAKLGKLASTTRRWATGISKLNDERKYSKLASFINNPETIAKANYGAELGINAMLMRTMENYQEARDVHQQTYTDAYDILSNMSDEEYDLFLTKNPTLLNSNVDIENKDEVAKYIAGKAADRTFSMDFGNVIFDIAQLHGLNKIGKTVVKPKGKHITNTQQQSLEELKAIIASSKAEKAALTAGKTAQEAKQAALKAEESVIGKPATKLQKTGKFLTDIAKFNALTIAEESTEGIEEAVNYIAQQEGLTYGKMLLEGNGEEYLRDKSPEFIKAWTKMQGNLSDYTKTAELQESAFWGVVGGWIFGGVGGGSTRISKAIKLKAALKEQAAKNPDAKSDDTKYDWFDLIELSKDKAAVIGMQRRTAAVKQLSSDLKDIENGINIYGVPDENGNRHNFEGTDVEYKKKLARRKAENEFIAGITIGALDTGTYDLLESYFSSDEMKKAAIELELNTEENIAPFTDRVLAQMREVKDIYTRQATHVMNQLGAINGLRSNKVAIPLEYGRIISRQNTETILEAKRLDSQIIATQQEINDALEDETDENKNKFNEAGRVAQLYALIDSYSRLEADKKDILKHIPDSYERRQTIRRIEGQQENIIKELDTRGRLNGANTTSGILYATVKTAMSYNKVEDSTYERQEVNDTENTDAEILKEVNNIYKKILKQEIVSDEDIIRQTANSTIKDINNLIEDGGIYDTNTDLVSKYQLLAALNTEKALVLSKVNRSRTQIFNEVDFLHNSFNNARKKIIDKAREIVVKAIDNYSADENFENKLHEIISESVSGNKQKARQLAEQYLSDGRDGKISATDLMDALDVIKFTEKANQDVYEYFTTIIAKAKLDKLRKGRQSRENSTNSENPISATQSSNVNNPSSNALESSNESQMNSQGQLVNQQPTQKRTNVYVSFNNNGRIKTIKRRNKSNFTIPAILHEDGSLEIDLKNTPKPILLKYINNNLLNVDENISDLISDDVEVVNNPIVKITKNGYKIVRSGDVTLKGTVEQTQQEEQVQEEEIVEEEAETQESATQEEQIEESESASGIESSSSTNSPVGSNEESNTSAQAPSINEEQNNATPQEQANSNKTSTPTNLPTGEGVTTPNASPTQVSPTDNTSTQTTSDVITTDDLSNTIKATIRVNVPNLLDENINYDALEQGIIDVINSDPDVLFDSDIVRTLVKEEIDKIKSAVAKVKELKDKTSKAAVGFSLAARFEEIDTSEPTDMLSVAAEAILNEYVNNTILPNIDGKQVIDLEAIVKICKKANSTNSDAFASMIYDAMIKYLDKHQDKYIIKNKNNKNNVVQQRAVNVFNEEVSGTTDSFSVDLNDILASTDEDVENQEKELAKLKKGDKVNVVAEEGKLAVKVGSITIGSLGLPKVVNDAYVITNSGWVTSVKLNGNEVISESKDVIARLFTKDGKVYDDIRSLLTQASLLNTRTKEGKEKFNKLVKKFGLNRVIEDLINESKKNRPDNLIYLNDNGEPDLDRIFRYLVNLWSYSTTNITGSTREENKNNILADLNAWFRKLYYTYDTIRNLNDVEFVVDRITEGQPLFITNNVLMDYDTLELASNGLADLDNSRIAISDDTSNDLYVSGRDMISDSCMRPNSTVIVMNTRSDIPVFVNTIGVKLSESVFDAKTSTGLIHELIIAAQQSLQQSLVDIFRRGINADSDTIIETITKIIRCAEQEDRIALFAPIKGKFTIEHISKGNARGINIFYTDGKGTKKRFNILHKDFTGAHKLAYSIVDEKHDGNYFYQDKVTTLSNDGAELFASSTAIAFYDFIRPICNINISRKGVKADNLTDVNNGGFITKKDGKLIFTVPTIEDIKTRKRITRTYEFDSYNDFLIKNNLIKVNIKKNEKGSNFETKTGDVKTGQKLFISLPIRTKTIGEVKTNTEETSSADNKETITPAIQNVEKEVDVPTVNEVHNIITTNKTNAGVSIITTIAKDTKLAKEIQEALDEANATLDELIPTRFRYKRDKNSLKADDTWSGAIATTVKEHGRVYYELGDRFINMISSNNPKRRKFSIDKLIHEQIHGKLRILDNENKEKFLHEFDDIYDEFYRALSKRLFELRNNKDSLEYKALRNLKTNFDAYGNQLVKLEEFVAESLTNKNMLDFLNTITTDNAGNTESDNFFNKVIKFIAKLFGININDDSLLRKTITTINQAVNNIDTSSFNTEEQLNEAIENETNQPITPADEIIKLADNVKLDDSESQENNDILDINEDDVELNFDDDIEINDARVEEIDTDKVSFNATVEEVNVPIKDFVKIGDSEAFKNKLPSHIQAKFASEMAVGAFQIKCR